MLATHPEARLSVAQYTFDEAIRASKEYFKGDDLAASTFVNKYALKYLVNGEFRFAELTPHDMHDRLAREFARIEAGYPNPRSAAEIRKALDGFQRIVPQGSPMYGIGNPFVNVSLSNCVVAASPQDSISSILDTGKDLANLFKRRCVSGDSFLIVRGHGPKRMRDVVAGDYVLSFDTSTRRDVFRRVEKKFRTAVSSRDRVTVSLANGAQIHTSRKHPVLVFEDAGYRWRPVGQVKVGDVLLKPTPRGNPLDSSSSADSEVAWFIGAHIGDGSIDVLPDGRHRFRNTGDNEGVIAEYAKIFNYLTGSRANYHRSYRKDYQTPCWEYSNSNTANSNVSREYLDGQTGRKRYSAFVPRFITENGLWWPFIAGLVDTDGYIKGTNTIAISLCAKRVIDEVAVFLAWSGVRATVEIINNTREKESTVYRLTLASDGSINLRVARHMRHPEKRAKLLESTYRPFSHGFVVTDGEISAVLGQYENIEEHHPGNLATITSNLRREHRRTMGIGALNTFVSHGIMATGKQTEIMRRVRVISIEDDTEAMEYFDIEVMDTNNFYAGNYGLVNIHNCGVGVDISSLRPDGSPVNNSALTTTGAWSFADFYSYVCRMIGQNGRRGALMVTMDIRHPDVDKFITMKRDLSKVTGANVSILLTDEFMRSVESDGEWVLRWPVESSVEEARVVRRLKARDLWRLINESAVVSAEPGLLFWDNYRNNLPAHRYHGFETVSVNPCSEIALSAHDACRLISLNLKGYVRGSFSLLAQFDFNAFLSDVRLGMRLMDDLVDLEIEALSRIIDAVDETDEKILWGKLRDAAVKGRRTGLGTHGLADCLASLNLRYDSDEALATVDRIYRVFRDTAYDESVNLAIERGPFPISDWETERDCEFIQRLPNDLQRRIEEHGRRNISLLTVAPTGSVSILSQTSSGIEPVFAYTYTRRKKINPSDADARVDFVDSLGDKWAEFAVFHHNLADYLRTARPDLLDGSKESLERLTDALPEYFVTAGTIDPKRRVEIQGTIQKYIDHGVSSTLNLPKGTTVEQGQEIYEMAWRYGLKGVTIYVDGSRSGVLVNTPVKAQAIAETHAPRRPDQLSCDIHNVRVGGENWTFLVGLLEDRPYEIFGGLAEMISLPKRTRHGRIVRRKPNGVNLYDLYTGDDDDPLIIPDIVKTFANPNYGVMTRLLSAHLRHGVPVQFIVQQLSRDPSSDFTSFARVVGRVLKKYIADGARGGETCPECGTKLVFEQGCSTCKNCGQSRCD